MAGRHVPCDFRAVDDHEVVGFGGLLRNGKGAVAVGVGDVVLVRLVLQVLGERDGVHAVPQRLLHPDIGENAAVAEDRVLVKIADEGAVIGHAARIDVREMDAAVVGMWVRGLGLQQDCEAGKQQEEGVFHCFFVLKMSGKGRAGQLVSGEGSVKYWGRSSAYLRGGVSLLENGYKQITSRCCTTPSRGDEVLAMNEHLDSLGAREKKIPLH